MTRFQFLKQAGFTGASLWSLMACVSEEDKYVSALEVGTNTTTGSTTQTTNPSTNPSPTSSQVADTSKYVDKLALDKISKPLLSLNLAASTNKNLLKRGGYIRSGAYVVALSKDGLYLAAPVLCTHEPLKDVIYSNEEWYCTAHGARFTLAGKGINKNGNKGLSVYRTATDGTTLLIY